MVYEYDMYLVTFMTLICVVSKFKIAFIISIRYINIIGISLEKNYYNLKTMKSV